jgi:hypothetical protein
MVFDSIMSLCKIGGIMWCFIRIEGGGIIVVKNDAI